MDIADTTALTVDADDVVSLDTHPQNEIEFAGGARGRFSAE